MRTKSINKLNSVIKRHFEYYTNIQDSDWRKKYFNIIPTPFDTETRFRERRYNMPVTNSILSTLAKAAEVKGYIDFYKCIHTTILGYKIYYSYGCDYKGYYIKINDSEIFALKRNQYIRIRSNSSPEELDIDKYLNWYVEKQLYPEGTFRNAQIWFNVDKTQALKRYKKLADEEKEAITQPIDKYEEMQIQEKALKRRLLKKKNIQLCDYSVFKTNSILKALKGPRYKRTVKAIPPPNMFDIMEDATWMYDTEVEILQYCEEQIQTEPNVIYI